jgi:hypothetical protein
VTRALILAALLTPLLCGCPRATPVPPPAPPPTVTVGAAIHWTEVTAGVTSYIVFRNGVKLATVQSPATSYSDNELGPGTYTYTVDACIELTCSAPSNPETIVLPVP